MRAQRIDKGKSLIYAAQNGVGRLRSWVGEGSPGLYTRESRGSARMKRLHHTPLARAYARGSRHTRLWVCGRVAWGRFGVTARCAGVEGGGRTGRPG